MNWTALPAAAAALAGALRACAVDPGDQVRIMLRLADAADGSPVGGLLRRAALTQVARACAGYVPNSYDDARALREQVCARFDAEILAAGNAGRDQVYLAFRILRLAVSRDLQARGDPLPRLRKVAVPQSLPASVLAHTLYGDATRADDLVQRTNPVHPLFMPQTLTVLDS